MKYLKYLIVIIVVCFITIYFGVKDSFHATKRVEIEQKIFTIGDINYQKALKEKKNIVKFGPIFWGLYPGGLVFSDIKEAKMFISKNKQILNQFSLGWAIYELSGDFTLDTIKIDKQYYLNKSLFIKKLVFKPE